MKTKLILAMAVLGGSPLLVPALAQNPPARANSKTPGITVSSPPPSAPAEGVERKPRPAQSDRYVWVPGHYRPENNTWNWVEGGWHLPPTDISVWIEPSYDEENKRWYTGYWQPDVPAHGPAPSSAKK